MAVTRKRKRVATPKRNPHQSIKNFHNTPIPVETVIIDQDTPKSAPVREMASRSHKKRVPVGTKNVLDLPQIPGHRTRWINDVKDGMRMRAFKDAGYEFVMQGEVDTSGLTIQAGADTPIGTPISKQVGGGIKAYLMKQREDYYQEDQRAKQREIDALEQSLRRKRTTPQNATQNGQYGEVTIGNNIPM